MCIFTMYVHYMLCMCFWCVCLVCYFFVVVYVFLLFFFFFFSSRRRHTRCREVSWARRCVQETVPAPCQWTKAVTHFPKLSRDQSCGYRKVEAVLRCRSNHRKCREIAAVG
eukprot:TRINITY_DN5674_c0_g1_i5.p2 TRINITY_DN5674_c0_g1~~TRINITY_DN5674_c0_g1_i5.p2  ORF type:complete len:111 (-),score=15.43 TRINITY_DN5674_c0_g1_i5:118-450(-)